MARASDVARRSSSPKWTMRGRSKDDLDVGRDSPGPGKYKPLLRSSSPSFSIGSRTQIATSPGKDSPGPGKYNPLMRSSSPSFSLKGRSQSTTSPGRDSPGPVRQCNCYVCVCCAFFILSLGFSEGHPVRSGGIPGADS